MAAVLEQTSNLPADPFVEKFLSRVPADVADTFSDGQLDAIKLAFGARSWGSHAVDIRLSIPLITKQIYLVMLAGRERRTPQRSLLERALHPFSTLANFTFLTITGFGVLGASVFALYVLKSAFGINLLPEGSVGMWGQMTEQAGYFFGTR